MFYSSECIEHYKNAWDRIEKKYSDQVEKRRQNALELAAIYGRMLVEKFGAKLVKLVGSTLQPGRFNERSDIDLVVYSMPKENFFNAVAACMNEEFDIDVIPYEDANEFMKKAIERSGVIVYEKQFS